MSEEMSVNLNERKENDDCVRVCLFFYFFIFFLLVVKSFGWPFCSA